MKVQAGTPMTEVIKQCVSSLAADRRGARYAQLTGINEAECRFLVGGKALRTDKPLDELVAISNGESHGSLTNPGQGETTESDCTSCSCMPKLH